MTDTRPNPSYYLVATYPLRRTVAKVLGIVWGLMLVFALAAELDQPPSPWHVQATLSLMAVALAGGLGLMIACAALVLAGRRQVNDRLGLFLLATLALPYVGVIVALLRARQQGQVHLSS